MHGKAGGGGAVLVVKGCFTMIATAYGHSRLDYGTVLANTAETPEKSANSDKSGMLQSGSRAKVRKKLSENGRIAFLGNSMAKSSDFV
jgi:hypothetical protein